MAYQYKRYRKNKASIIPIEETYTDLDINNNDENVPSVGYRFDSPRRWATAESVNKSVGVRDLHLTPSSGDIRCKFLMYAKTSITGYKYTWEDSNPDDVLDADWEPKYVLDTSSESTMHVFGYGEVKCLSSDFDVQITPENNFEEIITEMLNFVNDASWKTIERNSGTKEYELHINTDRDYRKGQYYVKEQTIDDNTIYAPLNYVNAWYWLKSPITYYYEYDSNTCDFDIKPHSDLRRILMLGHSKPNNNQIVSVARVTEYAEGTNNNYCFRAKRGFDYETKLTHIVSGSTVDYNSVYLGNGVINVDGNELLLIVKLDDKNSIKAVYDLFNQPMPDISTLPVINLEDGLYVVPFKKKVYFQSHFCYGTGTAKSDYIEMYSRPKDNNFNNSFVETNLNLSNVWDRLHLIYHASFAETRHRVIGRNGDHWDTPNKQFMVPAGDQDQFYIRFTTDGTHPILPIGCHFNVDLCFIHNPTNNTATGSNHDSFKD